VNPNNHPIHFSATLSGADGERLAEPKSYRLEAGGAFQGDIGTIFGANLVVQDAVVRVNVQDPPNPGYPFPEVAELDGIAGFQLIALPEAKTSFGLSAHTAAALGRMYSAQVSTVPGAMTNLKLVNTSGQIRTVTLEAVDDNGKPLAPPAVLAIKPGESMERDVTDLFNFGPLPVVGSLIVRPDGSGILGDVLFGDFEYFQRAAALPLEINPATRLTFGQIANGMGYYTGLAVFNPGQERVQIRLRVFSAKGEKTGEAVFSLPAGGRLSRLLADMLPQTSGQVRGYVVLESDQPIVAQGLFATEDLLAAVRGSAEP